MAALREESYRTALLTNNVRRVVDSAFVGMRKPDPEIYELCVARLGVRAGERLFVDDREDNCAGGGASAAVCRRREEPEWRLCRAEPDELATRRRARRLPPGRS